MLPTSVLLDTDLRSSFVSCYSDEIANLLPGFRGIDCFCDSFCYVLCRSIVRFVTETGNFAAGQIISERFVNHLGERLNRLSNVECFPYSVGMYFIFTGLMIEAFSETETGELRGSVIRVSINGIGQVRMHRFYPRVEMELLSNLRGSSPLSGSALSQLFLRFYTSTGRNTSSICTFPPITRVRPEVEGLLEHLLAHWLAFCNVQLIKTREFIEINEHYLTLPHSVSSPLSRRNQIHFLGEILGMRLEEDLRSTDINQLLPSGFYSNEAYRNIVQEHVHLQLRELIDSWGARHTSHRLQSRFTLVLRLLPLCEDSIIRFAQMRITMKHVFYSLNQWLTLSNGDSSEAFYPVLQGILMLFNLSSVNLFQDQSNEVFWRRLIRFVFCGRQISLLKRDVSTGMPFLLCHLPLHPIGEGRFSPLEIIQSILDLLIRQEAWFLFDRMASFTPSRRNVMRLYRAISWGNIEGIFGTHQALPIADLLEVAEDLVSMCNFTILFSPYLPTEVENVRECVNQSNLTQDIYRNLIVLQSYLRQASCSSSSILSSSSDAYFSFPNDTFYQNIDEFLDKVLSGFSEDELLGFRYEYRSFMMELTNANVFIRSRPQFISMIVKVFFTVLRGWTESLHDLSVEHLELLSRLSTSFVNELSIILEPFSGPEFLSYLIWEIFNISGVIRACFSDAIQEDGNSSSPIIMLRIEQRGLMTAYTYSIDEFHLRLFWRSLENRSIEALCRSFLSLYTPFGRNQEANWPFTSPHHILPELSLPFSKVFEPWFHYCERLMAPVLLTSRMSVDLVRRLRSYSSLQSGAALVALDLSDPNDEAHLQLLDTALNSVEERFTGSEENFRSIARRWGDHMSLSMTFSRYSRSNNVELRLILLIRDLMSILDSEVMSYDNLVEAESILVKLTRYMPFYEQEFQEFCRIRLMSHHLISCILSNEVMGNFAGRQQLWNDFMAFFLSSTLFNAVSKCL